MAPPMKRGRSDSHMFVGDAVTIDGTRAYCTATDDETIASAVIKFAGKQRATLQLTRRMLQHAEGYGNIKTKTNLKKGTWLVLPGQKGAKIEGRVVEYLGWDRARKEQQWRVQAQQGEHLTLTVDSTMLLGGLGWVTRRDAKSRVGTQLVSATGRKAEVVAYCPPGPGLDDRPLWKVRHDDDDYEDIEEPQLVQAQQRAENMAMQKRQPMTVAEIIAAETAAIQKRWKEQKVTENPLSLNMIGGSSIFPSVLDVVSSNDDVVVPPVRLPKAKKMKVSSEDVDAKSRSGSPTTPKPLKSRYTGVTWEKRTSKWQAKIYNGERMQHLGTFPEDMEEAAARAFDEAALRLRGAQAKLNFPAKPAPALINEHTATLSVTGCSGLDETVSLSSVSSLMSDLSVPDDDLITIDDEAGIFDNDPWCVSA